MQVRIFKAHVVCARHFLLATALLLGCGGAEGTPPSEEAQGGVAGEPAVDATGGAGGQPREKQDAGPDARPDVAKAPEPLDAAPDSALAKPTPSCTDPKLSFCEDFEAYAPGPLNATSYQISGLVPVVDAQRFAHGGKSLHVHAVNGGMGSQLIEHTHVVATGKVMYGRMFVWIDKLPKDYVHWTLVGATGKGVGGETRIGGILEGSQEPKWIHKWGVGGDHGPKGDWTRWDNDPSGHASPVETQKWVCIEWLLDASKSEIRFWKDAVEHPSMHVTDVPLPAFDTMWFGLAMYQHTSQVDYDVWFDDLALAKERIGCERAN